MTSDQPSQIDAAELARFRARLGQRASHPFRLIASSFLRSSAVAFVLLFVALPLLADDTSMGSAFTGRRALIRLGLLLVMASFSTLITYRGSRDTLALDPEKHRELLQMDLERWTGRRWLAYVLRTGLLITLGVGISVGLVVAFTTPTAELPGGSRLLSMLEFLGMTAAWAFPMAFLIRWWVVRDYRSLRSALSVLVILVGLAGAAVRPAAAQTPSPAATPEIVTTGNGNASLPPDRVVIRVGVATRAASASAASTPNGPLVARVQDTLRTLGISPAAVRAISFGVAPTYDYQSGRRLVDYEARTTLEVRLQDVSALGRVLDAVLAGGATDISSLIFESDSVAVARRRALGDALSAARSDAEALAKAAGGRLGALRLVTTTPESPSMMYREGMAASTMPPAGIPAVRRDVTVSVVVQTRWALVVP